MIRNMKVRSKILFGYVIALICALLLGISGILGVSLTGDLTERMYRESYLASEAAGGIRAIMLEVKAAIYQGAFEASHQKDGTAETLNELMTSKYDELVASVNQLEEIYPDEAAVGQEILAAPESIMPVVHTVLELMYSGQEEEATALIEGTIEPGFEHIIDLVDEYDAYADAGASAVLTEFETLNKTLTTYIIVILIAAFAISITIAFMIIGNIRKAVQSCEGAAAKIAQGDLSVNVDYVSKDELGSLANNLNSMTKTLKGYIGEIANLLSEISKGNLDIESKENYLGDFSQIGTSLVSIIDSLNSTFSSIDQSAEQVSAGSNEVSRGAQALAQGATEQSASVEELSATLSQIADQVNQNAENAQKTNQVVGDTIGAVELCNSRMDDMLSSMSDIDKSSAEIAKIIKVIDDISFQTNILALNAAVEAARAGSAGQGFAVVADEVRNLAAKSAEAAKETSALIEESIGKVEIGNRTARETAEALVQIVDNSAEVGRYVTEIASASEEQSEAITQVNTGVDQISAVVQANSATSEESAASSEELSSQAAMLKEMVSHFKLRASARKSVRSGYDFNDESTFGTDAFDSDDEKY